MARNLIDNCKVYLNFYYNSDGTWVAEPKHKWNGKSVAQEAIAFTKDLFHFLMDSTFLNEWTIMWLKSNLNSMRAMVDSYNNQADAIDRVKLHNVESIIDYDKRKLKKYFSADLFDDIFAYPEKYLSDNIEMLDSLQRRYMVDKTYMQAMLIKIPKEPIAKQLDERSWALLLQLLKTYSKQEVNNISNGVNPLYTQEMFGYFNYLISSSRLNAEEQKRLKDIHVALGI